jgi:5-methylthioadenosine/S-adenosylhomocysteine deaminase
LVYAAARADVSHAWIAGRPALEEGHLTSLDESELRAKAHAWQTRIADLK